MADVTILDDTPERVEAVIGMKAGRPKRLVVDDIGDQVEYSKIRVPKVGF